MTKTFVDLPRTAERGLRGFVEDVDDRLSGSEDNYEVVEDVLVDLNGDRKTYETYKSGGTVSNIERARVQNYNPRNATLESEYYAEKDDDAFAESKPLQWLWRQFDNTPMADNVAFGLEFRRMLAGHLFDECGDDCRFFKGITMTYGHNISVGDNTVVHDHVHLDDRGELTIGNQVSISDGVHVYTHSHDIVDQTKVTNYRTEISDNVRLTYDSVVHAGARVGENAMVGSRSIVRNDVPAHHIAVGTPAESVRIKPGWESVAAPLEDANVNRQEERRIEYDLDIDEDERFDEFQRTLSPPDD
ncbi:acetyltransferase [Halobacteriales archaeon QS_8_69_26]|nr:MAG: acetyltransferase [Halobacteriales archaeon QS_8_69_26]